MTAKTAAERQAARRKRLAQQGDAELRGVYAPTRLHATIKQVIQEWLAKKPR